MGMLLLIVIVLLLILLALKLTKFIPALIVLAILYSIFGEATLFILFVVAVFYFRRALHKMDEDEKNKLAK